MNLVDAQGEKFTFLDRITISDGEGGYTSTWQDGATIDATLRLDNSALEQIAQAQTSRGAHTIITKRSIILHFHDVLRREKNKKTYRITSNGDDNQTPRIASLDMRAVTAEEWVIPND